jgi:tRNA(Ile)-lysidine synthase
MPARMPLGKGWLARPLLAVARRDIEAYAHAMHLCWVEDPSNTDLRYDRNLLRQRLLPELQQRWPGVAAVLARAAAHQADQLEIATALAGIDYSACRDPRPDCLDATALSTLPAARQRNLLRYWVELNRRPVPSRAVVERMRTEVLACREDGCPLVQWPGAELRRYRHRLFIMSPLSIHDPAQRVIWHPPQPLSLDSAGGMLSAQPVTANGWRIPDSAARVEVRFRRGGETLQPAGRSHHHRLGHLFQEWGVPPWERDRIPLVHVDGQLAAVAGRCVAAPFAVREGQSGYALQWRRND